MIKLLPIDSCHKCYYRESMSYFYSSVYCSLKLGGIRQDDFFHLWHEYLSDFGVQEFQYAKGFIQYHARIKDYYYSSHKFPEWCPLKD